MNIIFVALIFPILYQNTTSWRHIESVKTKFQVFNTSTINVRLSVNILANLPTTEEPAKLNRTRSQSERTNEEMNTGPADHN
jgi:hypothetical protein